MLKRSRRSARFRRGETFYVYHPVRIFEAFQRALHQVFRSAQPFNAIVKPFFGFSAHCNDTKRVQVNTIGFDVYAKNRLEGNAHMTCLARNPSKITLPYRYATRLRPARFASYSN